MKKIILAFLTWRILLFIPLYVGYLFIPYRQGYDYTNIWKFTEPYFPVSSPLLFPWANFDGVHYLSISGSGYLDNQGFFPLYPILIKLLATFFGGGETFGLAYFISGFLISNISLLLLLIIFFKLITLDFSRKVAWQSIIFLLVFPTSFFFAGLYTESTFLLFTLLSFYFARKRKWFLAGTFGLLLSTTRLVGIAIFPALVYEFIKEEKKVSAKILNLLLVPMGIASYVFYNFWQTKNPLIFIEAHQDLNPTRTVSAVILLPQTLYRYFKILTTVPLTQFEWWIALLEVSLFTFAASMLYIAFKKKVRPSYILFSAFSLLIPASSGTFSAVPRYALVLFPIFIGLALVKDIRLKLLYSVISAVLLLILLSLFARGYFIA